MRVVDKVCDMRNDDFTLELPNTMTVGRLLNVLGFALAGGALFATDRAYAAKWITLSTALWLAAVLLVVIIAAIVVQARADYGSAASVDRQKREPRGFDVIQKDDE